ncbi:O-linked N-acetylglucosamine transferase, SPINDLY family protein [Herminiimonas arsenitoxidans]|uniref:O-linked N-acetylglucosamine transferase, SPINDLY family protein n=1 Tax=Herminiimonas arsenitoxidans TaxID=1809410 RepID=UPI0009705AFA|nr:tetratricopeptide repeat protein [Herminiimonas arsenitoxidans]
MQESEQLKEQASDIELDLQAAINFHQNGNLEKASIRYRQILKQEPNHVTASHLLGVLAYQIGKHELAINLISKAITLKPDNPDFYCNLGTAYQGLQQTEDAIACYRNALLINPAYALAHNNLGSALKEQGRIDEAIVCFQQALSLQPDFVLAQNNLSTAQGNDNQNVRPPLSGPEQFYAEALRFAAQFEVPLKAYWPAHTNTPDPKKRIKLGYVSGDFRNHAVAYFIQPIFVNHDHAHFEVFCYSNSHIHDDITEQLKKSADHWIVCKDLSEDQLAAQILQDGIDVLVDLSGHTAHNRLLTFARKPAPVQVTSVGIPASTGLQAIDYRLTDIDMDPPGMTEAWHTETLVRLSTAATYQPPTDSPEVSPLPALSSPVFTLACLNNLAKISKRTIRLWSRILHALPSARLILGNARNEQTRQQLFDQFSQQGIAAERIILKPNMPLRDYLALHGEIDLALDPFPYNGGTTSNHSLWMGVPVITLAGNSSISRVGVAIMSRIGLTECIATDEEDYLRLVVEYANDLPRLSALRSICRTMVATGSGSGPKEFTLAVENAYRTMWRTWCASQESA